MRLVVSLVLVALALTFVPEDTDAHSGDWYVSKWNGTYLRTCPSTSCGKILLIPNGGVITLDRHRGNWAMGWYGDYRGWVSLNVIRAVAAPAPQPPASGGSEACFNNTWGSTVCAPQWMADEIASAAATYGVSYWTLMSVAACESNFDPATTGWAGEVGIFQWIPSTWEWIGQGDRYNTYDQIWATARAFANGYAGHWTCYHRI